MTNITTCNATGFDFSDTERVCGEPATHTVRIGSETYGSCEEHATEWDGSTTPEIAEIPTLELADEAPATLDRVHDMYHAIGIRQRMTESNPQTPGEVVVVGTPIYTMGQLRARVRATVTEMGWQIVQTHDGWSLHDAEATDAEIAEGDARAIRSGEGRL